MRSPISYVGGKNRLANTIISLIPKHTTYVETFAGGAQVLFRKSRSEVEVINDLDSEIVNFYRVCQSHHAELVRYLRFMLLSRKWFDLLRRTDPETLTDIQRAARHFFLLKAGYGGRIIRQNFAARIEKHPTFTPARIPKLIEDGYERLKDVVIECLPYEKLLKKYDRAETFFYLDPPYYGTEFYRFNWSEKDFVDLEARLRNLGGKFLLSINSDPKILELFSAYKIEKISIAYSLQRNSGREYGELLIRNY